MRVIVLGCGLVGKTIVSDLARVPDLELTVVDCNEIALRRALKGLEATARVDDLSRPETTRELVKEHDLVVDALPGELGFQTVVESVKAGRAVVDLSFMPEDPFAELNELAKEAEVPVVVDCGVSPGLSHLLVGRAAAALDSVHDVTILAGGLPVVRRLPYEYGAVSCTADVLELYTRPAHLLEGGLEVVRPALTELEQIDVPGVGTLEAFLTDGLRTLLHTIESPNMKSKTLRYPGHCERIQLLVDSGLLREEKVDVAGVQVRPRDFAESLLREAWHLGPDEEDLTVLHVEVVGVSRGAPLAYGYDVIDVFDSESGTTSTARMAGFTCSSIVKLLSKGSLNEIGVVPLERIGSKQALFDDVLHQLGHSGIHVAETLIPGT